MRHKKKVIFTVGLCLTQELSLAIISISIEENRC